MRVVGLAIGLAGLLALLLLLRRAPEPASPPAEDRVPAVASSPALLQEPHFASDALPDGARVTARSSATPIAVPDIAEEGGARAAKPTVALEIDALTPDGRLLIAASQVDIPAWTYHLAATATPAEPASMFPEGFRPRLGGRESSRFMGLTDACKHHHPREQSRIGCVEFEGALPVWVSLVIGRHVVATQRVEPGAEAVMFTVSVAELKSMTGGVTVRMVDADTALPLAGTEGLLIGPAEGDFAQMQTGADGRLLVEGQPPLQYGLHLSAQAYESQRLSVEIVPGELIDLGTVALHAGRTIRGRVLDAKHGSLSAVSVLATAIDETGRFLPDHAPVFDWTEPNGRFELSDAGPWRYRLDVFEKEWTAVPVFVGAGRSDADDVTVTAEPGAVLHVHAGWPDGESHGLRVESDSGWAPWESERTGVRQWSMQLPLGRYQLHLLTDGKVQKTVPVDLSGPETVVELTP